MATVKINNAGGGTPVHINSHGGGTPVTINTVAHKDSPSAPVIIQQTDTTKQIWFEAPQGYKAAQCAYKVQGGPEVNATSTVIQFGDINLSAGDVEIYVKASTTNFQSPSVFNTGAFTQEIFLTACTAVSGAAADFYTAGSNGMFLNAAPNSKISASGTAIKVILKLAAIPSGITLFWIFVYRKNGATYDRIQAWQLTPIGDFVVGVNEMYLPAGFAVQAGDYVGWAYSNNAGLVAMFPRTDDTAPGTTDIYRATSISLSSPKDFAAGTSFEDGYYPIILKALP
jgi:hypothetical protein